MNEKRKFRCRIEEVSVIATYLLSSFERDQSDFESFSSKFGPDFMDSYREKLGQVNAITIRESLVSDQKVLTSQLYEKIESIRPLLMKIEGYITISNSLKTIDFGIIKFRHEINKKNFEGVKYCTNALLQLLIKHSAALAEEGLPADTIGTLTTLLEDTIEIDRKQQEKVSEINVLVEDNVDLFNELWEQMSILMNIGKRIYKDLQPAKLDDYTMETLKSKVSRHRSPQTQEANAG